MAQTHILVLDDDEDVLEMIEFVLLDAEYAVMSIGKAQDLWPSIQRYHPDIVIIDYLLTDGDGIFLCQALKAMPQYSHIPVIITTAYSSPELRGKPGGCEELLFKPFDLEEFLAMIRRHAPKP